MTLSVSATNIKSPNVSKKTVFKSGQNTAPAVKTQDQKYDQVIVIEENPEKKPFLSDGVKVGIGIAGIFTVLGTLAVFAAKRGRIKPPPLRGGQGAHPPDRMLVDINPRHADELSDDVAGFLEEQIRPIIRHEDKNPPLPHNVQPSSPKPKPVIENQSLSINENSYKNEAKGDTHIPGIESKAKTENENNIPSVKENSVKNEAPDNIRISESALPENILKSIINPDDIDWTLGQRVEIGKLAEEITNEEFYIAFIAEKYHFNENIYLKSYKNHSYWVPQSKKESEIILNHLLNEYKDNPEINAKIINLIKGFTKKGNTEIIDIFKSSKIPDNIDFLKKIGQFFQKGNNILNISDTSRKCGLYDSVIISPKVNMVIPEDSETAVKLLQALLDETADLADRKNIIEFAKSLAS